MLYTRKGDSGTTKVFDSKHGERISKASCQTEALGALDELNSWLGFCKTRVSEWQMKVGLNEALFRDIIHQIQKDLFIIQAEVAGAEKTIARPKVLWLEGIIDDAEKELPPIKNFVISGGSDASAILDVARTMARRTERRVIEAILKMEAKAGGESLAYLNRLSSLLYALARLANAKLGLKEDSPDYL